MINKKYFLSFILLCNVNNNQCANNTNGDQDPIVKIQQTQSYFDIQDNIDIVTAFISIPKYNTAGPTFSMSTSPNTFKIEIRNDELTTIIYGQFNNHYLRITMNIKQLIIDGNSSYVEEYNYTHDESTIFDYLDVDNISSSYNAKTNILEINIPKYTSSAAKHTKSFCRFIR